MAIISVIVTYLSIHFNLDFNVDLTLLSIAIVFPLVFNIRGAFRRREKALEHMSQFRSAMKTVYFYIQMSFNLKKEDKDKLEGILEEISDAVISQLENNGTKPQEVDGKIKKLHDFTLELTDFIPSKVKDRIFRYMNALQEGFENAYAINTHRTPQSLKAYCLVFIYLFPLVYAPTIIYNIGAEQNAWVVYFIILLTEFILISLYNIQDQMEYPFDNDGPDDVKLDSFKINR